MWTISLWHSGLFTWSYIIQLPFYPHSHSPTEQTQWLRHFKPIGKLLPTPMPCIDPNIIQNIQDNQMLMTCKPSWLALLKPTGKPLNPHAMHRSKCYPKYSKCPNAYDIQTILISSTRACFLQTQPLRKHTNSLFLIRDEHKFVPPRLERNPMCPSMKIHSPHRGVGGVWWSVMLRSSSVMHRLVGAGRCVRAQLKGETPGQMEARNRNALWAHPGWLFFQGLQ